MNDWNKPFTSHASASDGHFMHKCIYCECVQSDLIVINIIDPLYMYIYPLHSMCDETMSPKQRNMSRDYWLIIPMIRKLAFDFPIN